MHSTVMNPTRKITKAIACIEDNTLDEIRRKLDQIATARSLTKMASTIDRPLAR
jgi:hypothetical protein